MMMANWRTNGCNDEITEPPVKLSLFVCSVCNWRPLGAISASLFLGSALSKKNDDLSESSKRKKYTFAVEKSKFGQLESHGNKLDSSFRVLLPELKLGIASEPAASGSRDASCQRRGQWARGGGDSKMI